ncbi:MAG: 3-oxoacyl-ACP reductase FabG [Clostridia bacterium]|nr:3-oxoacyl-ACP reductase FabG [Clostridia bacterium]
MKTVWITGASGGIGNAAARLFAQAGYQVAAGCFRGKERAETLCAALRSEGFAAEAFGADLTDSASVETAYRAIEAWCGGVDVLVNNAGIAQQKLLTDVTDEEWRRMFAVNTDAAFYCCRAVIPHMVRRQHGRIVNVSSVWGVRGASCEAPYSASKAALIGLTKALAKELGPSGITVNCVAPGVIDTPMNACFDDETMRALAGETPLCRIGTPEEAARAILFFASEEASFITGQTLCADGGFMV